MSRIVFTISHCMAKRSVYAAMQYFYENVCSTAQQK